MILGSDIDSVVIDIWPALEELFWVRHKRWVPYERVYKHDLESVTQLTRWHVDTAIEDALKSADLPVYQDAKDFLRPFMLRNNVVFITSRKRRFSDETYLNLAKHFPVLRSHIYYSNGMSKAQYVESLGVEVFVEDRVKHVIGVAEECPGCKILLMDRPWNRRWNEDYYENVTRVRDWEEIAGILEIFGKE